MSVKCLKLQIKESDYEYEIITISLKSTDLKALGRLDLTVKESIALLLRIHLQQSKNRQLLEA